ncbi:MAG: biopolymer transporter ExbD [Steroidobacteraceae bacterium]
MKLNPRRPEEPEVSLVALIDVVLMLVVFFMLSSTFVEEGRLRIRLPSANADPSSRMSGEPLVIAITQSGSYRVNDRELVNSAPETLRAAILKVASGDRGAPVNVRADGRTTHQSVVTAMDVLGKLGFREINIATVRDQGASAAPAAAPGAGPR